MSETDCIFSISLNVFVMGTISQVLEAAGNLGLSRGK
jgi:hypothetical protein